MRKRKPSHPGEVLDELYIKPLKLNLQKLAERLGIARNTLFKIRAGKASVTPSIALSLSIAFDTTPQLWLNLQQAYDLWIEENEHKHFKIQPILKNGAFLHLNKMQAFQGRPCERGHFMERKPKSIYEKFIENKKQKKLLGEIGYCVEEDCELLTKTNENL